MPTAYLHVGLHKTGTTAFQHFCFAHGDALRAAGLAYPRLPNANHSHFIEAQFVAGEDRARAAVGPANHILVDERAAMRAAFERDLAGIAAAGLDVVVSGENASYLAPGESEALVAFLRRFFGRVVVLALVRPPLGFARSMAQEALKGARWLEEFVAEPPLPHYESCLAPYHACADELRVRPFRPDTLRDGCVLQTLLGMMDGDRRALRGARAARVNESASATASKFLSILNRGLSEGRWSEALPDVVRQPLEEGFCGEVVSAALREAPHRQPYLPVEMLVAILAVPGPRFRLPLEIAREVERGSEADCAWISARLGEDILAGEGSAGDAPPLAAFRRLSDGEGEAIAAALRRVNETVGVSWSEMEAAVEAERRREAADYVDVIVAGDPGAGRPGDPAGAPPPPAGEGVIAAALRPFRTLGARPGQRGPRG